MYNFKEYINYLNEGLIKTYDLNITIPRIKDLLNTYNITFNITKLSNNTFDLYIEQLYKIPKLKEKLDIILTDIFNLYGWFPSSMELERFNGFKRTMKFRKEEILIPNNNLFSVKIRFESKFDEIVSKPKKLYHLTIKHYKKNILEKGLQPKSKNKLATHDYDGRIYLTNSIKSCEALILKMKLYYETEKDNIIYNMGGKYNKNTDWILLEIDTGDIDVLYKDPNYVNGYYFLGNIHPDDIKIIKEE